MKAGNHKFRGVTAVVEAAIGPAIVSSIYRNRKSTPINQSNLLNK